MNSREVIDRMLQDQLESLENLLFCARAEAEAGDFPDLEARLTYYGTVSGQIRKLLDSKLGDLVRTSPIYPTGHNAPRIIPMVPEEDIRQTTPMLPPDPTPIVPEGIQMNPPGDLTLMEQPGIGQRPSRMLDVLNNGQDLRLAVGELSRTRDFDGLGRSDMNKEVRRFALFAKALGIYNPS